MHHLSLHTAFAEERKMTYSIVAFIFVSSYCLTSIALQPSDCFADSQTFLIPDVDPDDINPPVDDKPCENAVKAALECQHFYSNSFLQTTKESDHQKSNELIWLNAAAINSTTLKNAIVETSGKTADFLGDIAFSMDKAETWREDKVAIRDPASVTRKMMAAKYLAELNSHNFGAAIQATETLARSTFTSFFSLGVS